MKILASSLRRLATEHRLKTFAIVPNPSQRPEAGSTSTVLTRPDILAQYPGSDLVGVKFVEKEWIEAGRYRIISNHPDSHNGRCECREDKREHEFVESVLDHCENTGTSGFLYHQHGKMAMWWIETAERMRGFEIERLDDLVKIIVGKEGWGIEGLKYPDSASGTAIGSGASSRGARDIQERFENIPEWLKAIGIRGTGRGAATKKRRATR